MGKLKRALAVASVSFIEAAANSTNDPVLKAFLKTVSYAVLVPYAFLKEILPTETELFVKNILESGKITKEVINSPEFQQALGGTLQSLIYVKEREKRELIKKVFTGAYIGVDEYAKGHLERLETTAQNISLPALQHLVFLKLEILPVRDMEIDRKTKSSPPLVGFTKEEDIELKKRTIAISQFYYHWYEEQRKEAEREFNRQTTVESRTNYDLIGAREQKWRLQFKEYWVEYLSLGIFQQGNDPTIGTVGGGSGTVQYLTKFGEEFLVYVDIASKIE